MNFNAYTSYFHDGSIIDIKQEGSSITLSMESAEMLPEENLDNLVLSQYSTLKGRLHLEGLHSILESNNAITSPLKMVSDWGEILDFKINGHQVILNLRWIDSHGGETEKYSFYTMHAASIWFENIPDLYDPFRTL